MASESGLVSRSLAKSALALAAALGLVVVFAQSGARRSGAVRSATPPLGHPLDSPLPTAPDSSPASSAVNAYNRSGMPAAEKSARAVVRDPSAPPRDRATGRWVLAFAQARQGRLAEARQQFALLREESRGRDWFPPGTDQPAASDPRVPAFSSPTQRSGTASADGSADEPLPTPARPLDDNGLPAPTLEEEAAYQHAVLTAALAIRPGQPASARADAEAEYRRFLTRYPQSPLIHAVVRRIGRFHHGDIPADAERLWRAAADSQLAQSRELQRDRSLCAPEVLAEIERRLAADGVRPNPSDPHALATEMGADHHGASLTALLRTARRRGFDAHAYEVDWTTLLAAANHKGRWRQGHIAVILQPGHLVLLESANFAGVDIWDPSPQQQAPAGAAPEGRRRHLTPREWSAAWSGSTLVAPSSDRTPAKENRVWNSTRGILVHMTAASENGKPAP